MSLLFETIKIQDGLLKNIEYHNRRMNKSIEDLFGVKKNIRLETEITIPKEHSVGVYKCNVFYGETINEILFAPYTIKNIERLRLIEKDTIEYNYKYSDRTMLNELREKFGCSENEEILILKNSFITDTTYTNVAMFDGEKWITPSTPLLCGTKRAKLLDDGLIIADDIKLHNLNNFSYIKLFNAMLDFDVCPTLPIDSIY